MATDDFVDIFDFGVDDSGNGKDEGTLQPIIKNDELKVDDDIELIGHNKIIESEAFNLKLYKKDGVIDSIEIECKCGRAGTLQLEYQNPSTDEELIPGESSREETDTERTEETAEEVKETSTDFDVGTKKDTVANSDSDAVVESQFEQKADGNETNQSATETEEESGEEFQEGLPAEILSTKDDSDNPQEEEKLPEAPGNSEQ